MRVLLLLILLRLYAGAQIVVTTNQYGVNFTDAVVVSTPAPVTFFECTFSGPAPILLSLGIGTNVTLQSCTFSDTGPHWYGQQAAIGIWSIAVAKLYVYSSKFNGLSVDIYEDAVWESPDVLIWACAFNDNNLRYSDGNSGWLDESGWGCGVCFMRTRGAPIQKNDSGNYVQLDPANPARATKIVNCTFTNVVGIDESGDQINLFESSNILVNANHIHGSRGFHGAIPTASNGIVTDDQWADSAQAGEFDWTTAGCVISSNTMSDASIALWAGHDNIVTGNKTINSGLTVSGEPVPIWGISRSNPEGWAQTNVVTGNEVMSQYKGNTFNYYDAGGGVNWTGNIGF